MILLLTATLLLLLPNGLEGPTGEAAPPPPLPQFVPLQPHLQRPIAAPKVPLGLPDGIRVLPRPSKIYLPSGYRRPPPGNIPAPRLASSLDFNLKPSGFQPVVPLRSDEEVIAGIVGRQVRTATYSNQAFYDKSGRPVLDPRELSCSFDRECCWANAEYPSDQLQWRLAKGNPNRNKFSSFFGPFRSRRDGPDGSYLILGTHGSVASDEAQFVSCLITCSEGSIILRARHWSTPNTLLRVCRRNGFVPESPLFDCVELPRTLSPGPSEVSINAPQDAPAELVIVAANMIGSQGDAAILDDISVRYTPCRGPLPRPPPPPVRPQPEFGQPRFVGKPPRPFVSDIEEVKTLEPLPDLPSIDFLQPDRGTSVKISERVSSLGTIECDKGSCDFENNNACSFANLGTSSKNQPFAVISGRFGNLLSGIRSAGDGNFYAAVELPDRTSASLASEALFEEERVVRFKYYEATDGIQMSACCDTAANCPFKTGKSVNPEDRSWRTGHFKCPRGTRQIVFICDNARTNVGVCGLDSILMMAVPDSNRAEDAQTPC